jgi:hypothetical protein
MKLPNDSHRTLHDQKNERSLCASITERNCTHGQCTASERRNWRARKIVGTGSLLIQRENLGTSGERACPFGLARKAPT